MYRSSLRWLTMNKNETNIWIFSLLNKPSFYKSVLAFIPKHISDQ